MKTFLLIIGVVGVSVILAIGIYGYVKNIFPGVFSSPPATLSQQVNMGIATTTSELDALNQKVDYIAEHSLSKKDLCRYYKDVAKEDFLETSELPRGISLFINPHFDGCDKWLLKTPAKPEEYKY